MKGLIFLGSDSCSDRSIGRFILEDILVVRDSFLEELGVWVFFFKLLEFLGRGIFFVYVDICRMKIW